MEKKKALKIDLDELCSAMEDGSYEVTYDYYLPILNILVPQVGQVPVVAGFLFFIVIALVFFISLLALHFTQYPCITLTSFLTINNQPFCLVSQYHRKKLMSYNRWRH
jgi:hypothetical protein